MECTTNERYREYGLWMIMMCQFRFTNYNKRIILVEDVDMGEAVHVWG